MVNYDGMHRYLCDGEDYCYWQKFCFRNGGPCRHTSNHLRAKNGETPNAFYTIAMDGMVLKFESDGKEQHE